MKKMRLKAFTMAEAILVMTILGIIATIMITTLKPAQFKDKGLEIMARKVLSEIDTAVTQILINDTTDGTLLKILNPDNSGSTFSITAGTDKLGKIFKKYLTATRQEVLNTSFCARRYEQDNAFYLKDGACVLIVGGSWVTASDGRTIFPSENSITEVLIGSGKTGAIALIYFDTNGDDEPNVFGKDQFALPVGKHGIMYDED